MSAGTREDAGRMWANTSSWTPRGMLEAVHEYDELPQTMAYFRATIGSLMEKSAAKFPLDPVIAQQIGQIVQLLDAATKMAPKVPAAVRTIHKREIDRLGAGARTNEGMWDRAANGLA